MHWKCSVSVTIFSTFSMTTRVLFAACLHMTFIVALKKYWKVCLYLLPRALRPSERHTILECYYLLRPYLKGSSGRAVFFKSTEQREGVSHCVSCYLWLLCSTKAGGGELFTEIKWRYRFQSLCFSLWLVVICAWTTAGLSTRSFIADRQSANRTPARGPQWRVKHEKSWWRKRFPTQSGRELCVLIDRLIFRCISAAHNSLRIQPVRAYRPDHLHRSLNPLITSFLVPLSCLAKLFLAPKRPNMLPYRSLPTDALSQCFLAEHPVRKHFSPFGVWVVFCAPQQTLKNTTS